MKQRIILLAFILLGLNASAQTLNVKKDNVVYQFPAAQAADMWYTDGKTLTIMDKAFTLSELTKMYVDFSTVTDNQVDVAYNGGSATVYIAGNIAQYVDATEASGHVVVNQLSNVGDDTCGEITYHLSGSCSDGQFYMTGSYKASEWQCRQRLFRMQRAHRAEGQRRSEREKSRRLRHLEQGIHRDEKLHGERDRSS